MSCHRRTAAPVGASIILRAVFTDDTGCLVDLDALPQVYVYDASVSIDTIREEAEAQTFASAIYGPQNSYKLSDGYYTHQYTIPSGATPGQFHDVWVGDLNGVYGYEIFQFNVTRGFIADEQELGNNTLVVIELDGTIANADGTSFLSAVTVGYATTYTPLYASPDLIRLEMGRWIDYIPDSTLALMAHISSKEANFIHGANSESWGNIQFARTRFVVFDTVWRCINIPGHGQQAGSSSGKRKSLGDLSISDGSVDVDIPDEIYNYVREQREEWWRVVNAGGNIVPGQGLAPTMAVKGIYDPDRRLNGRLWESPERNHYAVPTANRKVRQHGYRRGRFGHYSTRPRGGIDYRYPFRGTKNR